MYLTPSKTHKLKEKWQSLGPQLRETRLSQIEEQSIELLINTENKCRKFRTGEVDYSPKTNKDGKMWHLWKLVLRQKQIRKNCFTEILSLHNDLNISDFFTTNVYQVKQNTTNSRLLHQTYKCSAGLHRTKHLKSTQQQQKITTEN